MHIVADNNCQKYRKHTLPTRTTTKDSSISTGMPFNELCFIAARFEWSLCKGKGIGKGMGRGDGDRRMRYLDIAATST